MAAITVGRARRSVWGDFRALLYNVTVVNSGDTFATPFRTVENVSFDQSSGAGAMGVINRSLTTGVITFTTSGGSVTGFLQVIGK